MISKAKIASVRRLHQKKFRDEDRLFLVEGRKSVEMLMDSAYQVVEFFATDDFIQKFPNMTTTHDFTSVSMAEMERISTLSTPPEVLAVVRQAVLEPTIEPDEPILMLDRIADPGNLGTMIRTADWFGIRHVVCSPDCVDFYNPKSIQSTMGSFAHVCVHRCELTTFLTKHPGRRVLGTYLEGTSIQSFPFLTNDVMIVGSESHGISEEVSAFVTHRITIPRGVSSTPSAESLNAAIAAAIVMEHWAGRYAKKSHH